MKFLPLSVLVVLSSLSVGRAYPDGDARYYRNTSFIRAHFEIVSSIRHLKADLGVLPSSHAKTALIADFQSLQSDPDIEWWQVPTEGGLHENSRRRKSTRTLAQIQTHNEEEIPPRRKAFRRGDSRLGRRQCVVPRGSEAIGVFGLLRALSSSRVS